MNDRKIYRFLTPFIRRFISYFILSNLLLVSKNNFFSQEDILGGHSAVGNITLRILNDLASQEQGLKTQQHIQVC